MEDEDVLVIDEIDGRDGDPFFDMDDESSSDSDNENNGSEDDISDAGHSESASESEDYVAPNEYLTPDAYKIKLLQQKAWTETLKRPRSQSMENGSW